MPSLYTKRFFFKFKKQIFDQIFPKIVTILRDMGLRSRTDHRRSFLRLAMRPACGLSLTYNNYGQNHLSEMSFTLSKNSYEKNSTHSKRKDFFVMKPKIRKHEFSET
ncbi:hypothetical protein BpHYR1_018191 [Brachionus plicatilis]|uniref:Uncharacterized protein n=1 Tax=Brachionus plicatilis TaxID=10195 RepID=A0A3M7P948_BRAPC|nr:hypothetical protein BpHYR1_018191 [Brachionus plicatilis]